MKMRHVPCISDQCAKDMSLSGYGRYWDHLSLYGHMVRIEIQNHSRNKMWDSGKDHRSRFAVDVLYNWKFWKQPNWYGIRNAWLLLVSEVWRDFILDGFLIKFKASMPLLANLTFRNGRFLFSVGSPTLTALKTLLEEISKMQSK